MCRIWNLYFDDDTVVFCVLRGTQIIYIYIIHAGESRLTFQTTTNKTLSGVFRFYSVLVRLDFWVCVRGSRCGSRTSQRLALALCLFDCYFIILDYFDGINQFRRLSVYLVFDRSMPCGCGACSHY